MTDPVKNKNLQKGKTNNPNGRPKGVPNKRTLEARLIFDELEFDPIRKAITKLKEVQDPELYITSCIKLAKYYYPELKSIDHKIDPSELSDTELLEETERLLREARGVQS